LALGHRSVQDCQEAISSSEFAEWVAYDNIEPINDWSTYFGAVTAAIYNTMRSKRSDRVWKPEDFFPGFYEKATQTTEEQIAIVEMLNYAFGGKDLRGNKETPSA